MYVANRELPNYFEISACLKTLNFLHIIARKDISACQLKTMAHYDTKVLDDKLNEGELT